MFYWTKAPRPVCDGAEQLMVTFFARKKDLRSSIFQEILTNVRNVPTKARLRKDRMWEDGITMLTR